MAFIRKHPKFKDVLEAVLPPKVDMAARFCYFLDLESDDIPNRASQIPYFEFGQKELIKEKKKLAAEFRQTLSDSGIESAIDINNPGEETILSAISFLEQVANNERKKETNVVMQYADKLKKEMPPLLQQNKDINIILNQIKSYATNPDYKNIEEFYKNLTICINGVRQSANETATRLKQIVEDGRKTSEELMSDNSLFRMGSDISGLLRNIVGIKTRRIEDSLTSLVQDKVIEYVLNHIDKLLNAEDFLGAAIGIMIEFMHYLQKQKASDMNKVFDDLSDEFRNQIDIMWDQFVNRDSVLIYQIEHDNLSQVKEVYRTGRQAIGIKKMRGEEAIKKREQQVKTRTKNNTKVNKGRRGIEKFYEDGKIDEKFRNKIATLDFIDWTTGGDMVKKGAHGNIYELIQTAIGNNLKISGHAATDVLSVNLGSIKGDINLNLEDVVMDVLKEIRKDIEEAEKVTRNDRFDDLKEHFSEMNAAIEEDLYDLDEIIKTQVDTDQKLFIYHESLKLYTRLETGELGGKGFKGRELQALSAIDRLMTISESGMVTFPDPELLYNLVLNIPANALGNYLKDPFEEYLGIFAGMLMFDDIGNMAKEIATEVSKRIEYESIDNVHLYLINDVYVPSSMVLTYIVDILKEGANQIASSSTTGAEVIIKTGAADKAIAEYTDTNENREPKDSNIYDKIWNQKAEEVADGVYIQIIFLKGFLSFLKELEQFFN